MCGIFAYRGTAASEDKLRYENDLIRHRGPDNTQFERIADDLWFGFHRLSIVGLDDVSNQPLRKGALTLICNGEVYNYRQLAEQHGYELFSHSDCEVILHHYERFGIEGVKDLDAEFAMVLHDARDPERPLLHVARDHIGIRPLFWGWNEITDSTSEVGFASEGKALHELCRYVQQFPPGHWMTLDLVAHEQRLRRYIDLPSSAARRDPPKSFEEACERIRESLTRSVVDRMQADRELGLFLSGGIDSSLVGALAMRERRRQGGPPLKSFSIGLQDGPDLPKARLVAQHIGTEHYEVVFTAQEGIDFLEELIWYLETYDITTIRASLPMFLLSKYINRQTRVRALLSGEGSDEILAGYREFALAPDTDMLQHHTYERMRDISTKDVLRGDRSTAAHGLEVRLPFGSVDFIETAFSTPPEYKDPHLHDMEKYVLRKAFDDGELLPSEILWRAKEAFSDAVGADWRQCLRQMAESRVSDEDFARRQELYPQNTPPTKEAMYYRRVFDRLFPGRWAWTPTYWMPKWSTEHNGDPSATVLSVYKTRHAALPATEGTPTRTKN